MPQAILFIDGVEVRRKGLHAPKRNRGIDAWVKDLDKLFIKELRGSTNGELRVSMLNLEKQAVDEKSIRLAFSNGVGFFVDRLANWASM